MKTINEHRDTILEWFYLDKDDMTVRRAKNGYKGRYAKHDAVIPFRLCSYGYGGVHVPTTRTTVPYHHLITALRNIEIPEYAVIDHIDGNTLNNERSNIRVVTQNINCKNTAMRKSNTSGVTGINWNKTSNSFTVRKYIQGERRYLGHRNTFSEAKKLLESYKELLSLDGYTERHGK